MGLKERKGRMIAGTIPNVKKDTLRKVVLAAVEPGSTVSNDRSDSTLDGGVHGGPVTAAPTLTVTAP